MGERGLLVGFFHLAARNPIKVTLNIAAGVRMDLNGFDKILASAHGISEVVFTASSHNDGCRQGSSGAGRYDTKIEFKPNLPRRGALGDWPESTKTPKTLNI